MEKSDNIKNILLIVFLSLVNQIQSYIPFDGFQKCVIVPDACPNSNITFYLYTRNTQTKPHQLNMANEMSITEANFIKGRPFVFLLHGYTGHKDFSPNTELRPAFFQNGEYNIISVDYHPLATEPCYLQAVQNLPVVAKCSAHLLDHLISKKIFKIDDLHIIGFSLGAQTAGMIANYFKSGKLKRITGLDPAKPMFIFAAGDHKLGKEDAEFVDVMHTDVFQRGVLAPCGHVDFYVNGGFDQPGCKSQTNDSAGGCNHARAPAYYAESINSKIGFWGFKCKNWISWAMGMCNPSSSHEYALMGEKVSIAARGEFFVETNSQPPFAKGISSDIYVGDDKD